MNQQAFSEAFDKLTPRQQEVLTLVLAGEPDSEVAASLDIELATVRKHVQRIYQVFDSFISSEPDDRRSRRGDLFALFAQYKPELLGTVTEAPPEKLHDSSDLSNPFVPLTGMVEKPQQFFNRQKEISTIFEILNSGSSVAVIGDQGVGKSSVLQAICRQAKYNLLQQRQPVYLNLQVMANEEDFYQALCEQVEIPESKGYQLTRELKGHLLLLAIDNAEIITWEGFSHQITSQLRGLAEGTNAPLRLVLASRDPLDTLFEKANRVSPFIGICVEQRLYPWSQDIARAFIAARLDSTLVTFSKEDISQIVKQTGEHYPQRLMLQCHKLYEHYKKKHS